MKKQSIWVILLFTLLTTTVGKHQKPASFSSIQWAAGPLINAIQTDLNRYFPYLNGFSLNARTPFYFGVAELGVHVHSYNEYKSVEFFQLHCYLALLYEQLLWHKFSIYGGITVGNSLFHFDAEDNRYLQNESELTLGLTGGLRIPISARFSTQISTHYSKIFTFHPIETAHLGLNLVYQMKTPGWLLEFLK